MDKREELLTVLLSHFETSSQKKSQIERGVIPRQCFSINTSLSQANIIVTIISQDSAHPHRTHTYPVFEMRKKL